MLHFMIIIAVDLQNRFILKYTTGYNNEFYLTDKNSYVKIDVECFFGNKKN